MQTASSDLDRDRDELSRRIEALRQLLEKLVLFDCSQNPSAMMRQFLMDTLHLYLFVRQHNAMIESASMRDYLMESGNLLGRLDRLVEAFVDSTSALMDSAFVADEWYALCKRRSAIQAVRELYQETPYGEYLPYLATEALDERLENTGRHEGYLDADKIPAGVPFSHWWWWYPLAPPEA